MAKNTKKKTTEQSAPATKKVSEVKSTASTTEEKPVEQKQPVQTETKNFDPPAKKPIEELKFYFGNRQISALDNSAILRSRFLYQFEESKYQNCHEVTDKATGKHLGTITRMQLQHAWRMANSMDAKKKCGENAFFLSEAEWESELEIITKYVLSNRRESQLKTPVMFNEVWKMSEIEFEMLGLRKPKQVSVFLQTAIIGQMEENRRLLSIWRKIKKYPHKVALETYSGGIFSESDAKKLRTLKIKCLNDIRDHNVFEIKNLVLEKDFENIVKDINAAFKADLERRRDYRYKFYPFLTAFANFAVVIACGFYYQYTLIKNQAMTGVIMTLLTLSVLDFIVILIGGRRAKKRVKVVPDYRYFTKGVKWSLAMYFLVCLFTVGSVFFFYQRYDGYNDTLYYRYVDGGIAVAGLRDEGKKSIIIPTEIDGHTVVEIEKYSFKGDSITSVIVSDTVTYVDEEAFVNCSDLKSVTFSESVSEIGNKAFASCSSLERIVFDESADVVLYDNVFENCSNLNHIYNLESVSKIGNQAFINCSSLVYFDFGDNLTQIGSGAFKNCNAITALSLPESVSSIGSEAFYNCDGLDELIIPCNGSNQSITDYISFSSPEEKEVTVKFVGSGAIPANALKNAKWVYDVEIGENVSGLGASAFEGASNIYAITIPENITTLSQKAFSGCTSLVYVDGIEHIVQLGEYCFADCTSLSNVTLYSSLTEIADGAFKGTVIEQISLPATVTAIGDYAFADCHYLENQLDLSHVETIGDSAFENCGLITNVTFCPSLTTIGASAFKGIIATSIVLPETVTSIGQDAFKNCHPLTSFTTPLAGKGVDGSTFVDVVNFEYDAPAMTVYYIGTNPIQENAFNSADFVTTLTLSEGVFEVGEGAFAQMPALRTISIPSTLTTLPNRAFKDSVSLETINGLQNVTSIGQEAFMNCEDLQYANLSNVASIGASAFENAQSLTSVSLSSTLDTIPDKAFLGSGITTIMIPESVKTIGESAFEGSSLYGSISLEYVETIEANAFKNLSNVDSIGMLDSIKYIGDSAFEGVEGIINVLISSESLEYLGDDAFKNCYSVREIAVPYIGNTINDTESSLADFFYVHSYSVSVVVTKAEVAYSTNFEGLTGITSVYYQRLREIQPNAFKGLSIQIFSCTSSLQTIGESAFEDCTLLETVEGIHYLDSVPSKAFKNCSNLRTVSELSNAVSIGSYAFSGCYNLTLIDAPKVKNVDPYAFEECSSFSGINYLSSLETIGSYAFTGCTSLGNIYLNTLKSVDENAFVGATINALYIPSSMQTVGDYAFASSDLYSLTVEEGVTTIGDYAFSQTILNSVQLPNTITSIGDYAFSQCRFNAIDFSALSNVTLGDGIFKDSVYLSEALLPLDTKIIPAYTFSGCSSLDTCNAFNLDITTIGNEAFFGCLLSNGVWFNYALKTIGSYAFAHTAIPSIELHNTVTSIGAGAFSNCQSLISATVPFLGQNANDQSHGYDYMFEYSSTVRYLTLTNQPTVVRTHFTNIPYALRSVILENTVTIGESAFKDCYNITDVTFGNALTTIGKNAFEYCTSLSFITIPENVKEIPEGAFMYCSSLSNVNFSSMKVTKIGKNAFTGTAIRDITFAEGLVTVEENVFSECSIVEVVFSSTMNNVSRYAFGHDPYGVTVYVPNDELLEEYATLFVGLDIFVIKI